MDRYILPRQALQFHVGRFIDRAESPVGTPYLVFEGLLAGRIIGNE